MKMIKSRARLAIAFALMSGLAFAVGAVYAGSTFPSLERAVGDYGTLSKDLSAAIEEIKRKNATEKEKDELEKKKYLHDLEAAFERMREDQEHVNDIWKDLEHFFAADGGKDTSPAPVRKRPSIQEQNKCHFNSDRV